MKGAGRYPFSPYPRGWFCVTESGTLAPGQIVPLRAFGRDLVAWRSADGFARVFDAHCPHLGAHLGYGGTVENDSVRCPFHAWRFDGEGRCVEVPYAKRIPAAARIRSWPVLEWGSLVLVWHHEQGGPPAWTPELPPMEQEFLHHETRHWRVRTHVQEIGENGLDVAHVASVHGAEPLDVVSLIEDGPVMRFETRPPAGSPNAAFVRSIRRTLWGLGVSLNEFSGKVESRVAIARTPRDAETVDVWLAVHPRRYEQEGLTEGLGRAVCERVASEFEGDIEIWEHKAWVETPLLCDGDGPVGAWRRWSRQFYAAGP